MIRWTLQRNITTRHGKTLNWRDVVSRCGRFRIEQGHDEEAKRAGRPYTLLQRDPLTKKYLIVGDSFATIAIAKAAAAAVPAAA